MYPIRLAIISSHPIQYNAPFFSVLSDYDGLDVKTFYSWKGPVEQVDPEFGEKITWDIPLLAGYEYCFVENKAVDPGSHHFFGLDNPNMISMIKNWQADAILVYGWASKTHLSTLKYFHGRIPVFFRGDSTLLTGGNLIRQVFRKIFLRWVYRHIDIAFYPGQLSKEYFLNYGVPPDKLIHIPHAIDNKRFEKNASKWEKEALTVRRRLGIADDAFVLLFAGKLVSRKQPLLLLQAVQELVQESQLNLHLIFVGTGPLKEEILLRSRGDSYIHFLGFKNQSEMPLVYRLGDVYVLPSTIETWGLGVNEAMACSRPVLVSDKVGCGADLVISRVSGEIFPSGSLSELKILIRACVEDRKNMLHMRKLAHKFIDDWSIEKTSHAMGEFICKTVANAKS